MTVERAFGQMKERFRILKKELNQKTVFHSAQIVRFCVVLHNIFIEFGQGVSIDDNLESFILNDHDQTDHLNAHMIRDNLKEFLWVNKN